MEFALRVSQFGYPLTHGVARAQETKPYGVSLDQAVAVARTFGLTVEAMLSAPACSVCGDSPPLNTRCLICEVENRG
jgi:hypothetical protein